MLHNPVNQNLQNNYSWDSWLHSNVSFRNYLEFVALEVEDWIKEEEQAEQDKKKEEEKRKEQDIVVTTHVEPTIKERSRLLFLS